MPECQQVIDSKDHLRKIAIAKAGRLTRQISVFDMSFGYPIWMTLRRMSGTDAFLSASARSDLSSSVLIGCGSIYRTCADPRFRSHELGHRCMQVSANVRFGGLDRFFFAVGNRAVRRYLKVQSFPNWRDAW